MKKRHEGERLPLDSVLRIAGLVVGSIEPVIQLVELISRIK